MNNLTAIIPVKKNSNRLPNKNILPFGETNLLVHKIRQLKQVSEIDKIVVTSDSEDMLDMGKSEKVFVIKRPEEYANESRPFGEFISYLCDTVDGEHFMWACATSPLVEPALYKKACRTYFKKIEEGYDSLITVQKYQHYLFDENGPLNFELGLNHKNSEYLPVYHFFTNGINIAPKQSMKKWKYNFGTKAYRLEVDKRAAIDIDDIYDYEIAKALYNVNITPPPPNNYLIYRQIRVDLSLYIIEYHDNRKEQAA
jgi:N-acylneuraminate cytidylyltransferase